jgi:hypothetical protein
LQLKGADPRAAATGDSPRQKSPAATGDSPRQKSPRRMGRYGSALKSVIHKRHVCESGVPPSCLVVARLR